MSSADQYLDRAFEDGYLTLRMAGTVERVRYAAIDHEERWSDPEEKVRAALYAELIYHYEYSPRRIGVEVQVPRRTPSDWADLVVYGDDERKEPFIVIECKPPDISDHEFGQAIEQACGNRASLAAPYAGTVAGTTRRFLNFTGAKPLERQTNIIADLPINYGRPPRDRFYKDVPGKDLSAVPREELRSAIRKCHQTLWEGGRRSPIQAFGEFSKIIFVKIRDETDVGKTRQPYDFQRRTNESDVELKTRIDELYIREKAREPDVFTDSIMVEAGTLATVVEHLEGISLSRTDLDTKGVAFEEFMGGFFKGDFGQYFTPRELIAFCVAVLSPDRDDVILDPACGSGGFLLYALDHVRSKATELYPNYKTDPSAVVAHYKYWHDFAETNLFGIEINDELARVAKMNMIIHDDGHSNIVGHDALDFVAAIAAKKARIRPGEFNLILTNPPFGSVVREAEKGNDYLAQFELRRLVSAANSNRGVDPDSSPSDAKRGARSIKGRASIRTEILFLERVWTFLKPRTGRAAIVVPDGILTNTSLQGVRDWMMDHFDIQIIMSLPSFAFQHYDAAVKASIMILRKLGSHEHPTDTNKVLMIIAENIGYDARGRRTFDVAVEEEIPGESKVERHSSDLLDYRVRFEWNSTDLKRPQWSEIHREIVRGTGLVGICTQFLADRDGFMVEET